MSIDRNASRRKFLQQASLLAAGMSLKFNGIAMPVRYPFTDIARNTPQVILQDKRLQISYDDERMVMDKGLQPSLLCTRKGNLIMQAQLPQKPLPQERMFYPSALKTMVSRDGGHQWHEFPLKQGENGVNMEGGIIQLKDGTILVLDTYATPGDKPGTGFGQIYISDDEYKTLQGPIDITFNIYSNSRAASSFSKDSPRWKRSRFCTKMSHTLSKKPGLKLEPDICGVIMTLGICHKGNY